ncbi:hypothetical protein [Senegalia massiliensis]|uniref:Uncharacterized protein n=1 Tax=Senegalia massiliensis TaxID=1720316 RepID=A0A845R2F6_9CLOT|nr:hypothetical protein [Senegalia massiliensis]NBI07612.1 hypothetical protein [Senegalia massiliensis]
MDIKESQCATCYKYSIKDGVLFVFEENEGLVFYGECNQVDQAEVEDTISELCEDGILSSNAKFNEILSSKSNSTLLNKLISN